MSKAPNIRVVFDGRSVAKKIQETLMKAGSLKGKKLVILQCDGKNHESNYVRLKREMGEQLGVSVRVVFVSGKDKILEELRRANQGDADGVLVQLPLEGVSKQGTEEILSTIDTSKDIDGLNPKSKFIPAAVLSVETVLEKSNVGTDMPVAIVGARGQVGKRLYDRLTELGYVVSGYDLGDDLSGLREFKVVISCTGVERLIKPEMVKDGFVGIDLGYPRGEISPEAAARAGFITPVPGGVGPLTVVSLFVNLAGS